MRVPDLTASFLGSDRGCSDRPTALPSYAPRLSTIKHLSSATPRISRSTDFDMDVVPSLSSGPPAKKRRKNTTRACDRCKEYVHPVSET